MRGMDAAFHLPNGRVGAPYRGTLTGRDANGHPARVLSLQIPPDLGLTFDPRTAELTGVPLLAGEHRLALQWTDETAARHAGECLFIVNPDPRSLWRTLEPPADAPYPKPHTDSQYLTGLGSRILAASRRGRSHAHAAGFRDDDVLIDTDPASGWSLLLVADGAGSAPHAREGARLAVTVAGRHLMTQLAGERGGALSRLLSGWDQDTATTEGALTTELTALFQGAGRRALESIAAAAREQGATERDYATTLLTAIARPRGSGFFVATCWIGDGAIALYEPRGQVRLLGTPDSGEFAGQTRFLDHALVEDPGFARRIGIGHGPNSAVLLLMTDGVSDPRFETEVGLRDPARWDALWDEIAPLLTAPAPEQALRDWLDFFSPGYHDDRTLALMLME